MWRSPWCEHPLEHQAPSAEAFEAVAKSARTSSREAVDGICQVNSNKKRRMLQLLRKALGYVQEDLPNQQAIVGPCDAGVPDRFLER